MSDLVAGQGWSIKEKTAEATAEALGEALKALGSTAPGLAYVTCTVEHNAQDVLRGVQEQLPKVLVHGITTSLGGLSTQGVVAGANGTVGVLLLGSAGGKVGFAVGSAVIEKAPQQAGRAAAEALKAAASLPIRVVLFNASPGAEEDVLAGVAEVLPGVPAWGGSAADHAIAGEWKVITQQGVHGAAVSLAALCGEVSAGGAMLAPYRATGRTATVTGAADRRLDSLDGKPAAAVLNTWVGSALDGAVKNGGNILAQTALHPVGVKHDAGGEVHLLTLHPANVNKDTGAVDLFARVTNGQTLCEMESTADDLVNAWALVLDRALGAGKLQKDQVKAAVLIHCAGCAGALGARVDEAMKGVGKALGNVPLMGLCTFGEQGHVPGLGNLHQDLSLGLLLLA